jgi:ecotin
MKKLLFLTMMIAAYSSTLAQNKTKETISSEIKMFPKAKAGYKQVYIKVPATKNEDNMKIEVFAGKTLLVDCNKHRMSGELKEKNLEGWGYNYYEVESDGNATSTMMACPDQKKTKNFIYIPSELLRYNSKLPIVIYVPKDMEIKYKIWKAENSFQNSKSL